MLYFAEAGPRLIVETDLATPETWKQEPFLSQLRDWSRRDRGMVVEVVVRAGDQLTVIFPEGEVNLGPDRGLPIRSGYRMENGRPVHFAEFAEDMA